MEHSLSCEGAKEKLNWTAAAYLFSYFSRVRYSSACLFGTERLLTIRLRWTRKKKRMRKQRESVPPKP